MDWDYADSISALSIMLNSSPCTVKSLLNMRQNIKLIEEISEK